MSWADAAPNLLIGLREGLEAGLVITLLLAAVRRSDPRASTRPIWAGAAAAIVLALSFGAVLSSYTALLSSRAQEGVSGGLSVLAVALITVMIFWMRRTARSLSGHLRAKVDAAMTVGMGAVALTAFLAVSREGLETALFIWTAVRASGHTVAPLVGAGIGIAVAGVLCGLLFRKAITLNLGVFFQRTALLLIVVAAGVLSYGLGDLQDAGLLPGHALTAFDVSGSVASDSWWATLVTGVTNLATRMTLLQVVAWAVYLAVVLTTFVRGGRAMSAAAARPVAAAPTPAADVTPTTAPVAAPVTAPVTVPFWQRRRGLAMTGFVALLAVPAVVAAGLVMARPADATTQSVAVTDTSCGAGWDAARTGRQAFSVTNDSHHVAEVTLVQSTGGGIVAELETLGPGVTQSLSATLTATSYQWRCLLSGAPTVTSAVVTAAGTAVHGTAPAVVPATQAELRPSTVRYRRYVDRRFTVLARQVRVLRAALAAGSRLRAEAAWLPAQLTWESIGAAYGSFGRLGVAIDGLPFGLPHTERDPSFRGLHRIEWGLWHGQAVASLTTMATGVETALPRLRRQLPALTSDPTALPVRAHEILEDALRDHLSGFDDLGSQQEYAETAADVTGTRVALRDLAPLLRQRAPQLLPTARHELDRVDAALRATRTHGSWQPMKAVPAAAHAQVDASVDSALETLDTVPDLLEVPVH